MAATTSGSKRWTHYHSALQLAIQRSAHKWTSLKTELAQQNGCEDLLKKLDAKPNIDRLHAVVTEARAKKQAGYTGSDIWREDLHPSAAARAQIIPLLEEERERLKSQLAEAGKNSDQVIYQLDRRNRALQAEMQTNVKARSAADEESSHLLDMLDEVHFHYLFPI
ncbi:hypothetical protein PHLCEN_2v10141 [Hermanssonia centrifuga]|uniref:Uncharacterized protein n=1 Tax=Hermanssonia centrifuga TaxID=98765 RepID=A0A2R6NNR9_9APHY|nr:hypothetical protein PHLCEN_2v10141 [Hermanssonia centrifuga]